MFPSDNNLESKFTFETNANPLPDELPFHILLLGDWSGNLDRGSLDKRKPIVIDRDNFESVMQKLKVSLALDLYNDGKNILLLEFNELEDFHPDNVFRRISLFSDLRDVRSRLLNPDTFDDAATEVKSWFMSEDAFADSLPENQSSEANDAPPIDSTNLLDMILTQPSDESVSAKPVNTESSELGRFVSKIVSPHLIKIDENEQSKLVAAVDETISNLMREILHHPEFQELESAWRGLYFLVRRLETYIDLKIFILDISKDELSDNLKTVSDLTDSVLYRWLISETLETSGGEPFAVIGGNYSFGVNIDDVAALIRIAKLSNAAGAPFISYIKPEIFGIKSFSEGIGDTRLNVSDDPNTGKLWTALRSAPESTYLGLSPMKVLARLPYGESTDSIDTFSFEEAKGNLNPQKYLRINPCFAGILLLAQSYRLYGWEMGKSILRDIENLPVFVFKADDESKTAPCAEIVPTENMIETILEQGLLPLISFRDTGRIRVPRFQAVSSSGINLSGRWNS
jgi:type VI secretion system protein ImpC